MDPHYKEYTKYLYLNQKVLQLQWALTKMRCDLDTNGWQTEHKYQVDKLRHAVSAAEAAIMTRYSL